MAVDPSIALNVKPLQVADPLAQYAQVAQLQGFQNQSQVAQMQMAKMQQNERYLANMREAIINNGGPADMEMAAKFMATHPSDPQAQAVGMQMIQAQQELKAFNSKYGSTARPTGGFGGGAPSGELGSGTYGITPPPMQAPMRAPINALAPQAETAKNALLDTNALRQELFDLSQYPNVPQAKLRAGIIQKQLEEASKAFVVPNVGLVRGSGETIVASGMAPTDIKRLTSERDALPIGDPRRKIYDQQIADIGATTRIAQQRLNQEERHFQAGGYTYDLDRGVRIDRNGIATPLMQQAPTVGGASAVGRLDARTDPRSLMSTEPTVGGGIPTGRGSALQGTPTQPANLIPLGPKPFKVAPNELRDEVNALTKDFRVVQDAHSKIKNVANTGAGDMSLLYSFVKLLDPGSVVRESEFAAAAQSGSYGERIQGAVNRALTGQRLPDGLRKDFIREADNLYKSQKSGNDRIVKQYTEIAKRAGLNPEDVIVPYAASEEVIPDTPPPGAVRRRGQ
jgi:hypothetical protein